MAHIWVTHEELSALCNCSTAEARANVKMRNWARRRCSDGEVRLKLPEDLAYAYMIGAVGRSPLDKIADANVSELESLLRTSKASLAGTESQAA